ncbi:hypothetical protein L195_g056884, partial [Trifolium pratense]
MGNSPEDGDRSSKRSRKPSDQKDSGRSKRRVPSQSLQGSKIGVKILEVAVTHYLFQRLRMLLRVRKDLERYNIPLRDSVFNMLRWEILLIPVGIPHKILLFPVRVPVKHNGSKLFLR